MEFKKVINKFMLGLLIGIGLLMVSSLFFDDFSLENSFFGDFSLIDFDWSNFVTSFDSGSNRMPSLTDDVPVFLQFYDYCDYEEILRGEIEQVIRAKTFNLVKTTANNAQIQEFKKNDCVVRFFRPDELEDVLSDLQQDFDNERDQKFKDVKLNRTIVKQDVTDQDDLEKYLEKKRQKEEREFEGGVVSDYQLYVTPEAESVLELVGELGSDIQTIYDESLSWIWVSEETLNGQEEFWYYPEEFLTQTATLSTNPSPGELASDCSEQANTLASLLIASGQDEENVRVVLGLVDFGGSVGGHAWVEIYEDERWYALEATAGAYFDDTTQILSSAESISYQYFKYQNFPSKEIWFYYNHKYFKEKGGFSNAPSHWNQGSRSYLKDDLERYASSSNGNGQGRNGRG